MDYGEEGSMLNEGEEDEYDSEDLEREVLANQKKMQQQSTNDKLQTKKEQKSHKSKHAHELDDELQGLDDDDAALNMVFKKKDKSSKVAEKADEPAEVEQKSKKPAKFGELDLKKTAVKGDSVY